MKMKMGNRGQRKDEEGQNEKRLKRVEKKVDGKSNAEIR